MHLLARKHFLTENFWTEKNSSLLDEVEIVRELERHVHSKFLTLESDPGCATGGDRDLQPTELILFLCDKNKF